MAELRKPLPVPENIELTKPFWEAAKRHELMMQRCKKCADWIFYPREQCPNCLSQDLEFQKVSGRGRVYAYTTVYQPAHPAFVPDSPYVFAVVQLDEGVRVATNIVGIAHEQVKVDMAVEATYEDVTPDWTLVKFKPV